MPRKPANKLEDTEVKKENSSESKSTTARKATTKSTAKKTTGKKTAKFTVKESAPEKVAVKDTAKKPATKKASKTTAKSTTIKKTSTKSVATKSATKKSTTKSATTKTTTKKSTKSTSTKSSTKKSTAKKASSTTRNRNTKTVEITSSTDLTKKIEILEYYDLPYRYNQTVVKVLAQTPTTLFIYWDISDSDRANFAKQYGEDFFNYTKPVLIIHNNTMHYSFEIEIDDFANSWYLHVNDSNCEYTVELGRRPKYYNEERHIDIPNNYMYVTSSNVIDAPNDHVLFDKDLKTVYFKDVKTNIVTAKDVTSLSFLRNMGRIYNLYDLQSDFTKNSWINSNHWQLDLKNPSSSNPSSSFK